MPRRQSPEEAFLENLPLIEGTARRIARRRGFSDEDLEDFLQEVRAKLTEDDYRLIRLFGGRNFGTYLKVVIARLAREFADHRWGKWRPSAAARRMGKDAVLLERLLDKEGLPLGEALEKLDRDPAVKKSSKEIEELAVRLPVRVFRQAPPKRRSRREGATPLRRELRRPERRQANGPPAKNTPRYLQGRVLDASPTEPRRPLTAFRAGGDHEIQVRIGRESEDWPKPRSGVAFPDHELPKDRTEHELTVVFSEPSLLPEPQIAKSVLPGDGDSSECSFLLHVPDGTEQVRGRVVVLYKNRVLQTGLLLGRVVADQASGDALPADEQIRLDIEAVVRPGLEELDGRRRFDAALVLNHDGAGVPGVLKLAGDHAAVEVLPEIDKLIRWFDDKLSDVAYDKEEFTGGLEAPATVELLRELARHGAELYEYLVVDQLGADEPLVKAERLQVLSAHAEARFPIELVYGRLAPSLDAGLCEHAAEALRKGKCPDSCAQEAPRSCICPLAFWGLSRVIERHAHDPKLAREVKRKAFADYALQAEPIEGRRTLDVVGPALVAASQRVEKTVASEWKKLQIEVAKALKAPAHPATSWPAWIQAVKTKKARLHLLLVHTDRVAPKDPMQKMEIGQGSWLAVTDLDESHVRFPVESPAPFVILLGCETGAPDISFLSFPAKLRRKGAAVVVCAQSTIHAMHAVPVAEGLVTTLRRLVDAGETAGETTFGEVMRTVRRELLAAGQPMALCLTAYGDADWRLVAAEPNA